MSNAENPWKLALEGSGAGVWDWNMVTGAQTMSARWEEILGYAPGELKRGYVEFVSRVHPDDLEPLRQAVAAYLAGRNPSYSADIRMCCKDGTWCWISTRGMVVARDAEGNPTRMIGTHTDISDRKRAEGQLLAQSKLLRDIMESVSQGIFVFDQDVRLIAFNQRVCELLNLDPGQLGGHPTLGEISQFQQARGDFGTKGSLVQAEARDYVIGTGKEHPPGQYLRTTTEGRVLEIKTHSLPEGGMVRTFTEVSDYVQARKASEHLDQLLTATQTLARVGGWATDLEKQTVTWTDGVYRILDTSPQEYTPTTPMETAARFYTPASMQVIEASYVTADTSHQSYEFELEAITARGRRIWLHSMGKMLWRDGVQISRTSVVQDVTERKQAQAALLESEGRWKLALESTGDGVWDWHIPSGVEFFSKRLIEMYGYTEGEINNNPHELDGRTHPDDMAQLEADRRAHFDGLTPTYYNEHRVRCKDGSWKWVLSRGMVISRDAQGRPQRMIGTHTDITERKNAEALIRQQAYFDGLTGLPNRRMLRDRLEQDIKKSRRDEQQVAILFIDLDHFKEVNDTLGHENGDLLLVEAARRLQLCVRESDTVARMGGDEFTVILTDIVNSDRLEPLLQKLLHAMNEVFQLGGEQVFVSASIGITIYPIDGTEIEDLYKNADQALYVAKGAGRNRFSFFTPALQQAAQTRVRLANDLRTALSESQFRVAYQPIVELATGSVHKAEALIRWQHPKRGLVSPAEFIPIAEASGLIVDIGEWIFQEACEQVRKWRQRFDNRFQISVNRSPVQFQHHDAGQAPWGMQLSAMGLPGDAVVVEITEGLLLGNNDTVNQQLMDMESAGIQVSLDDFGTGYSSLAYLQKFNIDFVKIDQSFVRHLEPQSTNLALCKAIVVMAHALDMKVIAEGVETVLQRDLLLEMGCDYGQGYLFSRPVAVSDFETMLDNMP